MSETPMTEDQQERAAIMEFDGNLTRAEADHLAQKPRSWWTDDTTREAFSEAAARERLRMSLAKEARHTSGMVVGAITRAKR